MKLRILSASVILLALAGCESPIGGQEQTKEAALEAMCDIPDDISKDVTTIGPYLAEQIEHPEVIELLRNLSSPAQLVEVLKAHEIHPLDCDLVRATQH